jgi:hypothetical protein
MKTINLTFATGPKAVPIKAVVSRKLIKAVEAPIAVLRTLGQNQAFQEAMRRSPNAAKIVTLTGGANTEHSARISAGIKAEIPNITDNDLQAMVQQRIQAELLESFPEIWDALNNPVTAFPYDNYEAVNACFALLRIIIDDSQLTESEKTALASADFWDEQDLTEVTTVVASFREIAKL